MIAARPFRPSFEPTRRRRAGFSLIELLVVMVVFGIITAGMLTVFDSAARLARVQTQVSFMHQGQRVAQAEIVRYARAAGLGGLPITRLNVPAGWLPAVGAADYNNVGVFPEDGYAVTVRNRVVGPTSIAEVQATAPPVCNPDTSADCVLPGSDVLILRGVFSTPVYYFEPPQDISGWLDDGSLVGGVADENDPNFQGITAAGKFRVSGKHYEDYPQDLAPLVAVLAAAKQANRAEAFILRATLNPNAYVVMAFDHAIATPASILEKKCTDTGLPPGHDSIPNCVTFPLRLAPATAPGGDYADLASGSILNGSQGTALQVGAPGPDEDDVRLPSTIGSIGWLEEWRFFVRLAWDPQPTGEERLTPVFARQRFLPGTDTAVGPVIDIAENVIDLQIAVGVETHEFLNAGVRDPEYGRITPTVNGVDDEILFNAVDDDDGFGFYAAPPNGRGAWYDPGVEFYFLRINTLVESAGPDLGYMAPELVAIEDHNRGLPFNTGASSPRETVVNYNSDDRRRFRRRWLQTVVEMRNLL